LTTEPLRRTHLRVFGRVQGVYFRATTQTRALELGLSGWVRNRRDGSVEVVAEGPEGAIQALCDWAQQGPPHARVDAVDRVDSDPVGLEGEFVVRPTA
jgi:acylphosphatase